MLAVVLAGGGAPQVLTVVAELVLLPHAREDRHLLPAVVLPKAFTVAAELVLLLQLVPRAVVTRCSRW